MSYCRWSNDFGECDVYVYEDVGGGWTTHVASRRLRQKVPDEIKTMPSNTAEKWIALHQAEREWRKSLPSDEIMGKVIRDGETHREPIRFPKDSEYIDLSEISEYAGDSFNDPTPQDCAERLKQIRDSGLNVPQYAIDRLIKEGQKAKGV